MKGDDLMETALILLALVTFSVVFSGFIVHKITEPERVNRILMIATLEATIDWYEKKEKERNDLPIYMGRDPRDNEYPIHKMEPTLPVELHLKNTYRGTPDGKEEKR